MVAKYQLVFAKMESSFYRIFNSNRLRKSKQLSEAFNAMKSHALSHNKQINYKAHFVYLKLNNTLLRNVCSTYARNRESVLAKAFAKLKTNFAVHAFAERLQ